MKMKFIINEHIRPNNLIKYINNDHQHPFRFDQKHSILLILNI